VLRDDTREGKPSTAAVPCFATVRRSRLSAEAAVNSAAARRERESADKDVDKSPPTQKAEEELNRD
jgi:hypothetical protein